MIVVDAYSLSECCRYRRATPIRFRRCDDSDVYSAINAIEGAPETVHGTIFPDGRPAMSCSTKGGYTDDQVRVIIDGQRASGSPAADERDAAAPKVVRGYVKQDEGWAETPVMVVPVASGLSARTRGILETDILTDRGVFTAGVGSGGAPIVLELAKLGVSQSLMDHDRIELPNLERYPAGRSDIGRYKTKVLAGLIKETNASADTETWETRISWKTQDLVREAVRKSDLVICAVDDHEARVILNKICVDEGKQLIVAGAFRRAYGGQVLVVEPHKGPCYQCFLEMLPGRAADQEVSSAAQAGRIAYSDRPVAIEPGLSTDIAPISLMVVKLAIQILLRDKPTTLRSLDEDLVAPFWIWLNRREAQTEYEQLGPLAFNLNGMRILRWYGVALERNEACPVCGSFVRSVAEAEGFEISSSDAATYATRKGS